MSSIYRDNSQQTSCNVNIALADGTRKVIATASCQIRPHRGMSFTVDIFEEDAVDKNYNDVLETIGAYMAEEIQKARDNGIPVFIAT